VTANIIQGNESRGLAYVYSVILIGILGQSVGIIHMLSQQSRGHVETETLCEIMMQDLYYAKSRVPSPEEMVALNTVRLDLMALWRIVTMHKLDGKVLGRRVSYRRVGRVVAMFLLTRTVVFLVMEMHIALEKMQS